MDQTRLSQIIAGIVAEQQTLGQSRSRLKALIEEAKREIAETDGVYSTLERVIERLRGEKT